MATHRHTSTRKELLEEKRVRRFAQFQARLLEQEYIYANRQWRIISDYPDYAISEYGDVKRIVIPKGNGNIKVPGLILKPIIGKRDGYLICSLSANGIQKNIRIHIQVALAYIGPKPFSEAMVAHCDGNKLNNYYSNLRWTTAKGNSQDMIRHGHSLVGEKSTSAKLTWEKVREIRSKYANGPDTIVTLGKEYGVSFAMIWDIIKGNHWKEETPIQYQITRSKRWPNSKKVR